MWVRYWRSHLHLKCLRLVHVHVFVCCECVCVCDCLLVCVSVLQLWPYANTPWQNGMPPTSQPIELYPTVIAMATETIAQVDMDRRWLWRRCHKWLLWSFKVVVSMEEWAEHRCGYKQTHLRIETLNRKRGKKWEKTEIEAVNCGGVIFQTVQRAEE